MLPDILYFPIHRHYHSIVTGAHTMHSMKFKNKEFVEHLLVLGPFLRVSKKSVKIRSCGDYRWVNTITSTDRYPLPHINYFTSKLFGKLIFSKFELVTLDPNEKIWHQVLMSSWKTAIPPLSASFCNDGLGLCNATQRFVYMLQIFAY